MSAAQLWGHQYHETEAVAILKASCAAHRPSGEERNQYRRAWRKLYGAATRGKGAESASRGSKLPAAGTRRNKLSVKRYFSSRGSIGLILLRAGMEYAGKQARAR